MLNGKQKRYLRSLAVNLNSSFQIGKDGLSENLYKGVNEALKANELVKVNVLKTCETEINEIEIEICRNCKCELVQHIGKTLVLYKKSKEGKIILP
ncbi:MAG: ribosome assembly RNA-binding protein YhbY [Erysipelotrichaceae bacterium]|nr:ribosome assembly RNA-binding protein YhbY [Erysipelotrichaceae bacterium]